MSYTADEVTEIAKNIRGYSAVVPSNGEVWGTVMGMLDAYAATLRQQAEAKAGVTDEIVRHAMSANFLRHNVRDALSYGTDWAEEVTRAALLAVWPVAAQSSQPADSGRVTELLAYLDNQAQHPRDQFGNGSNKPNPTLKAWYAKQAAIVRALAAQEQPASSAGVPDDVFQDAERYRWLRTRPAQIGALLWRHAPWTHEGYAENQVRLDLCIDEERVDAMSAAPSAPEGDRHG